MDDGRDSQTRSRSFGAFAVSITEKGFEKCGLCFCDAAAVIFEGDDDTVFFVLGDWFPLLPVYVHRFNGIEYQIYGKPFFEICGIAEDGRFGAAV